MPLFAHAKKLTTATAVLGATALAATAAGTSAQAAPAPGPDSSAFREAVTLAGVQEHLDAFQAIADVHDGNRASSLPGHEASVDYVVEQLEEAGYDPTIQRFDFEFFGEKTPSTLAETVPEAQAFSSTDPTPDDPDTGADFAVMTYSGSGTVTDTPVTAVDTTFTPSLTSTSGCEAADFTGFPTGDIALIQRGSCDFAVKAANAKEAGASAVLIFNRGVDNDDDGTGVVNGTLGSPEPAIGIPVLGLSFEAGKDLGDPADTRASVSTDVLLETRNTANVIAETEGGDRNNVVMAGAHLDSVEEGPGINDNGTGSAAILEVAQQLADQPVTNKVRFAWWGAEESGLLGAEHYVADLQADEPDEIKKRLALYLNFDMVGSPNFGRFIYDGDNSLGTGEAGPRGSAQIETLFASYFASQGKATEPTAFDGRSDYGPFIAAGVPSGGLFTGAEDVKTEAQAEKFGGTAGEAFDPCYHQACDDLANVNGQVLDEMTDAIAHAVYTYSQTTASLNGKKTRTAGAQLEGKGHTARR